MSESDFFNLFFLFLGFYTSLSLIRKGIRVRKYRQTMEERKKAFKIKRSMFGNMKKEGL